MRKLAPIVFVTLLFSAGICWLLRRVEPATTVAVKRGSGSEAAVAQPSVTAAHKPDVAAIPQPTVAGISPLAEPTMIQHVFRLQLDQGHCTLEKLEEVSGAFGREKTQQWQPGMLCCRLVAEDGHIVGERTLPAPDYVCVVLDPNDESKIPVAARLTSAGPAVFQVRFPQITDAVRLEVHRIATEARPGDAGTSIGPLLASIPIPTK